jgi:hypothetical protein
MSRQIDVTLTQTQHEQPLVIIHDSLFDGDEAASTPDQLRHYAALLLMIAADAESHPAGLPDAKRSYPI